MMSDERNAAEPGADMVCVFRTGDEEIAAAVKAILGDEGISYVARNVELQELFSAGRGDGSFNFEVGSVDFLVSRADADRAREVLSALREGFLSGGCEGEDGDSGE